MQHIGYMESHWEKKRTERLSYLEARGSGKFFKNKVWSHGNKYISCGIARNLRWFQRGGLFSLRTKSKTEQNLLIVSLSREKNPYKWWLARRLHKLWKERYLESWNGSREKTITKKEGENGHLRVVGLIQTYHGSEVTHSLYITDIRSIKYINLKDLP